MISYEIENVPSAIENHDKCNLEEHYKYATSSKFGEKVHAANSKLRREVWEKTQPPPQSLKLGLKLGLWICILLKQ